MTNILDDIIDKSCIIDDVSLYTIEAYVSWTDTVVEITYPSKNPAWLKRSDCGSHSQHRWGLYNDQLQECVQAVVMHNSCLKATFNKEEICRNCEFRNVWRKTCTTPENIFYIIALSDVKECENLFNPLIISHKQVASNDLDAYNKTVPKGAFQVKQVRSNPKKRMQINRLEKNIEESVKASNQMKEKHSRLPHVAASAYVETSIQKSSAKEIDIFRKIYFPFNANFNNWSTFHNKRCAWRFRMDDTATDVQRCVIHIQ